MASTQVQLIRISPRIVHMGHQAYPLANISRVQTLQTVWRGRFATLYPLREIALWLLAIGMIVIIFREVFPILEAKVALDLHQTIRTIAIVVSILIWLRMIYLVAVILYRLLIRQPCYMLIIETAGTQYTALSGTDHREISRIKNVIINAIEHPPSQDQFVQIRGDVVLGPKFSGNIAGRDNNVFR